VYNHLEQSGGTETGNEQLKQKGYDENIFTSTNTNSRCIACRVYRGKLMKIEVKQYSTRWHAGFSKKIDSILTGKHHYKLLLIDLDEYPF